MKALARWLASILGILAGGFALAASPGHAQQTLPEGDVALRFRRVYAPADRLKDWPRGNTRYVPMSVTEFERLVRAAKTEADTQGVSPRRA